MTEHQRRYAIWAFSARETLSILSTQIRTALVLGLPYDQEMTELTVWAERAREIAPPADYLAEHAALVDLLTQWSTDPLAAIEAALCRQ